ncbi:MAG: YiiX family permuted papain-like enzyme [Flammeovirgaceae bacterium]
MKVKYLIIAIGLLLAACSTGDMKKKEYTAEEADRGLTNTNDQLQVGDIIFQTSTSTQSQAIQLATNSKYSHVGVLFNINNELVVLEAVQPVKYTPLIIWIEKGKGKHFVVKRLKERYLYFNDSTTRLMKAKASAYLNKYYDSYFEWSDDRMYCSELVWKLYKETLGIELGSLQALKNFDLTSTEVKTKLKERYGQDIPLAEQVISPAAIFESELLEEIKYPVF